MSNYIEYQNKIAFHPGYYIKEIIDESGLTQQDFAHRLDTTPKNLSLLIRGEQSLSIDIAIKLSKMLGTSVNYWLNLQNEYDTLIAEFKSEKEAEEERQIYSYLNYSYFKDYYGLPDLPKKINEQIKEVRKFLGISSLTLLKKRDITVNFRRAEENINDSQLIKSNVMVQIAINKALKIQAPKFDKSKFEKAVNYALTLTENHEEFYSLIYSAFLEAGVIFIILPNIQGSKTNGAVKKVRESMMLMVNDRRLNSDTFWFTLFHEIGHIINGDYSNISFEKETGKFEEAANAYARDSLIPAEKYQEFLANGIYTKKSIQLFAKEIRRDPGIVLGRLQNDGIIGYNDSALNSLRHKI